MRGITVQVKYGGIKVHSVCTTETLTRAGAVLLILDLTRAMAEMDSRESSEDNQIASLKETK